MYEMLMIIIIMICNDGNNDDIYNDNNNCTYSGVRCKRSISFISRDLSLNSYSNIMPGG